MDLITKFGETLLRSDLILAKQNVKNFQDRQGGEALVTDLFSEDDLLRNRSDRLANRFEPLVTSEKQQTFADVQGVPTAAAQRMDPAKIRASTTYEVVKQILAGR